jgi:amidohydrolase
LAVLTCVGAPRAAGADDGATLAAAIDREAARVEGRVVEWRRDLHRHPELSNRETRTAGVVAAWLEELGLEVRTGVAHTGVVGVLRGGLAGEDGPVVALRADMDALPVTEDTGLPFASTVRTTYLGREVGAMHACGHDAHTAILMGAAQVLARVRDQLPGTVVFLFQPAEEGAPEGEGGGAKMMIAEGALENPAPGAVFGLHVVPQSEVGTIAYRVRGAMASSDRLEITVHGRQTHAAYPWLGVDPIAVASRIVLALQAIPARQVDTRIPSVVSIGAIHGGVRHNIVPDEVELLGTIRSLDPEQRESLHEWVKRTAVGLADTAGATADVKIHLGYPVTVNDPELTAKMLPTLRRVAAGFPDGRVEAVLPRTGAEDFSFFAQEVPGLYFWLGIRSKGVDLADAAPNHSPRFTLDEAALPLGVRAMSSLAADFLVAEAGRD